MATHSSILAWRIPWTEELGGLQSTGREKSDMTVRLHFHYIKINAYGNEIQHEKYSQLYCNILVTVTINTMLIILQHIEISNHCIVHPELTQCCRSITLKFKKKKKTHKTFRHREEIYQNANDSSLHRVGIFKIFTLCFYVLLVVCDEYKLFVKLESNIIFKKNTTFFYHLQSSHLFNHWGKKVKISFSNYLSVISHKNKVCKDILIHIIIFW